MYCPFPIFIKIFCTFEEQLRKKTKKQNKTKQNKNKGGMNLILFEKK